MTTESAEATNDRLAREHPIDDYYDRSPWFVRWIERERLRIVRELCAVEPGMRLLEIGSGGGHVLRQFPEARLVAVDVSGVYLDNARRNLDGYDVEFHKGEIQDLAFASASFDRIVCSEVLEHVERPEVVLTEMARLLTPRGIAVVTIPNDALIASLKKWVRRTPAGWALRSRIDWGGDRYHLHQWRPSELRAVLQRHFVVTAQRAAPFDRLPLRVCYSCTRR